MSEMSGAWRAWCGHPVAWLYLESIWYTYPGFSAHDLDVLPQSTPPSQGEAAAYRNGQPDAIPIMFPVKTVGSHSRRLFHGKEGITTHQNHSMESSSAMPSMRRVRHLAHKKSIVSRVVAFPKRLATTSLRSLCSSSSSCLSLLLMPFDKPRTTKRFGFAAQFIVRMIARSYSVIDNEELMRAHLRPSHSVGWKPCAFSFSLQNNSNRR